MPDDPDPRRSPTATAARDPSGPNSTSDGSPSATGDYLDSDRPSREDSPASLPSIPGYTVESILGRGGMGVVYRARQIKADRLVALKMILGSRHVSTAERIRFQIEAEAVGRLMHPNIVQIHEIGEYEGSPYFSLEFCGGGTLGQKLKRERFSARQAAELTATLARAMHYAHLRGVVHRDLKPANVLLDDAGQPKIADFGLAKKLDEASDVSRSGAILGTPAYMAPEQAAGKVRDTGPGADVYALGATLYELLAGQPPFPGGSAMDTLQRVLNEEPARPSRFRPTPRDLETICLKCLQKDPAKRYASAELLADDLQRYLEDRPIQARPAGSVEVFWRWCRRNPTRAILSLAVVVLVLSFAITASILAYREYEAKKDLARSNEDLRREQRAREVALQSALRNAARLAFDRGLMHCEQGDIPRGMLTFARALSTAVAAGDADLEAAVRLNLAAWDRAMWRLRSVLPAPDGTHVWRAALHPDNRLIAVSLANNSAQIWDTTVDDEHRVLHTLPHGGVVVDLAFSEDGTLLLTRTEQSVHLWCVAKGSQVCPAMNHGGKRILAAALSPDASFVVTGSDDKTARFWSAQTGRQEGSPLQHKFSVSLVAIDAKGKQVLTASAGSVQVWDAQSRTASGPALTHKSMVRSAMFSSDGHRVLTGTLGKTVHVWRSTSGTEAFPALSFAEPVEGAVVSPGGETIAVRTLSGSVQLRHGTNGAPVGGALPHPGIVYHMAFSQQGQRFLTAGASGIVRVWESTPDGWVPAVLHHSDRSRFVGGTCFFSADGQTVVTVDRVVRFWQAPRGIQRGVPVRHVGGAYSVAFSNDGKRVLSGGHDGNAVLRDSNGLGENDRVLKVGKPISAVMFSPDGELAAASDFNGVTHVWEVRTVVLKHLLKGHTLGVNAAAFSPDNTTILTGSSDHTARLWNARSGQPIGTPLKHEEAINAVAFSHDGRLAYTVDLKGAVRVWDVSTGTLLKSNWDALTGVQAVTASRDGRFLLTGNSDKSARIWNAATGEEVGVPFLHQDAVRDVAFSLDGLSVLTGSFDRTARRWHVATGIPIGPAFKHGGRIRSVALSPVQDVAATASWDGMVALWETPAAWSGSPDQLNGRIQAATGIELDEQFIARMRDEHVRYSLQK